MTGAMLRLISLGVAIEGARLSAGFRSQQNTLIDEALNNRRAVLIEPLIAKGAWSTDDKPDQHKIDSAFRASLLGGSLALVQKLWTISADEPHPSLTFNDVSDDQKPMHKRVPVTLLPIAPIQERALGRVGYRKMADRAGLRHESIESQQHRTAPHRHPVR